MLKPLCCTPSPSKVGFTVSETCIARKTLSQPVLAGRKPRKHSCTDAALPLLCLANGICDVERTFPSWDLWTIGLVSNGDWHVAHADDNVCKEGCVKKSMISYSWINCLICQRFSMLFTVAITDPFSNKRQILGSICRKTLISPSYQLETNTNFNSLRAKKLVMSTDKINWVFYFVHL